MNDEAAFLAAIAAAPDDQTLPLVFADWLEEHDDPRGKWYRDHSVREWMGATFANPIPLILDSLAKDKKVIAARRASVAIGEPIVPGLVELLKHATSRVREQACMCLRHIGPRAKAAAPALMEMLSDPNYSLRGKAAKALRDIGADASADTSKLKAALTDSNWAVRSAASKVLGKMGAKASVLEELVEKFQSPLETDRIEAIEGLKQLGTSDAVTHLDLASEDSVAAVREAAVRALGTQKHATAVLVLCDRMGDRAESVRLAAVEQFAGYWQRSAINPDVVAAVIPLLGDKSAAVRGRACRALANGGKLGAPATDKLIEALEDSDTNVREAAAHAVGECGTHSQSPIAPLLALLTDKPAVAGAAASSLGKWPSLPTSAAPDLMAFRRRARTSGDWNMAAGTALTALGRLQSPPKTVLYALRSDLRSNDQHAAIEALTALGPAAEPAIDDLLARLQEERPPSGVVNALASIGGPAIDRIAELLDGPDEQVRTRVLQRLWDVRDAGVPLLPALMRAYHTTSEYNRNNILQAIERFGNRAAAVVPDLLDVLEKPDRADTAGGVLNALAFMGAGLVPHLSRLAALSLMPHLWKMRGSFAFRLADAAEHTPDALGPLRALLRASYAPPDETERWTRRDGRTGVLQGLSVLANRGAISDPVGVATDLRPLVTDPEAHVREDLPPLLGKLGVPGAPLLCQLLSDDQIGIRAKAADALAETGDTSEETLAALVHALEDREARVRRGAADTLNKLKTGTPEVLTALEVATADTDAKVAERAAVALKKLTPKAAKTAAPKTKGKKKP